MGLFLRALFLCGHALWWHNTHKPVPSFASLPDSPPQLCKQLQFSRLIDSRFPLNALLSLSLLLTAVTAALPSLHHFGPSGFCCLPNTHFYFTVFFYRFSLIILGHKCVWRYCSVNPLIRKLLFSWGTHKNVNRYWKILLCIIYKHITSTVAM